MGLFKNKQTQLFEAIDKCDLRKVKSLVEKGCSLSEGENNCLSFPRWETPYALLQCGAEIKQ